MATNPSVKAYDHSTGVEVALSEMRNKDDQGGNTYSQAVHAVPLSNTFYPFFNEDNAVRIVTATDSDVTSYPVSSPLPAAILDGVLDVSDAVQILIYGSFKFDKTAGSELNKSIIMPIGIDDEGNDMSMPLPPFVPLPVNLHYELFSDTTPEPEHFFKYDDGTSEYYPFFPVNIPTFGVKNIGFHVNFSGLCEGLIIHAVRNSGANDNQRLYSDISDFVWTYDTNLGEAGG